MPEATEPRKTRIYAVHDAKSGAVLRLIRAPSKPAVEAYMARTAFACGLASQDDLIAATKANITPEDMPAAPPAE